MKLWSTMKYADTHISQNTQTACFWCIQANSVYLYDTFYSTHCFKRAKQHQRYKLCSKNKKESLKQTCINTHTYSLTHRNTHFPFVKNANKVNDWLIISPTCLYHYHVWSSLSISPQHSHFILHFSLFHSSFHQYFIPANCMKQWGLSQILIINIWLLQGAVQLFKNGL